MMSPSSTIGIFGGGHTASTFLCFCAFGELAPQISIWQTYNCKVILGGGNAKHLQGWQNYQPYGRAAQPWPCICSVFLVSRPGCGSILAPANPGMLPATSINQHLLHEARETLPPQRSVASPHQGWQNQKV